MALIPDLPPVEVDGRLVCDGGMAANLPLAAVLDPSAERPLACVAVDLLGEPGPPILSVDGMLERSNDLVFLNQSRAALRLVAESYAARRRGPPVLLVLVAYDGRGERIAQKAWDFGRRSIDDRWRAGSAAATPPPAGTPAPHCRGTMPAARPASSAPQRACPGN